MLELVIEVAVIGLFIIFLVLALRLRRKSKKADAIEASVGDKTARQFEELTASMQSIVRQMDELTNSRRAPR